VRYGFHAMAIDEKRRDLPIARWDSRPGVEHPHSHQSIRSLFGEAGDDEPPPRKPPRPGP